MGRLRKKEYLDVYLDDNELKRVKKGYTVTKRAGNQLIAVHHQAKDRKAQREILKLKERIKMLEGKR